MERRKAQASARTQAKSRINPAARTASIVKATDAITRKQEEQQDAARPVEQVEASAQYAAYETDYAVREMAYSLRTRDHVDTAEGETPVSPKAPSAPQEPHNGSLKPPS